MLVGNGETRYDVTSILKARSSLNMKQFITKKWKQRKQILFYSY